MSDEPARDDGDRTPPEGATCGEHPERLALARCPKCRTFACIACWHGAADRCGDCIRRDPVEAGPPVPWEAEGPGVLARLFATLLSALAPSRHAVGMAREPLAPAVRFALLTALVPAALRGVIPYTWTLRFGDRLGVEVVGTPAVTDVALDVARAMGISLAQTAAHLVALALPFVSLARAFGTPWAGPAAARVILYRAWLLPLALHGLVLHAGLWTLPVNEPPVWAVNLVLVLDLLPLLFLIFAMRATARIAGGISPMASFAVVLVPAAMLFLVDQLATRAIAPWVPPPPASSVVEQATGTAFYSRVSANGSLS